MGLVVYNSALFMHVAGPLHVVQRQRAQGDPEAGQHPEPVRSRASSPAETGLVKATGHGSGVSHCHS